MMISDICKALVTTPLVGNLSDKDGIDFASVVTPHGHARSLVLKGGSKVTFEALVAYGELKLKLRGNFESTTGFESVDPDHPVALTVQWAVEGRQQTQQKIFVSPRHWFDDEFYLGNFDSPVVITAHLTLESSRPWLRLSEASLGDVTYSAFAHACANYEQRLAAEIGHFDQRVYSNAIHQDAFFKNDIDRQSGIVEKQLTESEDHIAEMLAANCASIRARLELLDQPAPGEQAFGYAHRLLGSILPITAPNFFERAKLACARAHAVGRPLKILSLCAGAARIEAQILEYCEHEVELTLQDASPDLISAAAARMHGGRHKTTCILGDINDGLPGDEKFDVIVCVSAMHHVVQLERVLEQINARLLDGGEFWSIGEQIGKNGNRLWSPARKAAAQFFSDLPHQYRFNAHTAKIDDQIDDQDYSLGCFEGVRSQEIEQLLHSYLVPVEEYKRNCFLWRVVNAAYNSNYDLAQSDDVLQIKRLVEAEALHWIQGGRSTELHAVYRKRAITTAP